MISTKPKRGNSSGNPRRLMQSMSEAIAWLPASHRIKHSPESLIGSTRAWLAWLRVSARTPIKPVGLQTISVCRQRRDGTGSFVRKTSLEFQISHSKECLIPDSSLEQAEFYNLLIQREQNTMRILKVAAIAAALALPATASAEMSRSDKAGLYATIVLHGDRCGTPHSEFIDRLEKTFMEEKFDDQTVEAAKFTVVDQVKQDGGWAAWCRRVTWVFQKYNELAK